MPTPLGILATARQVWRVPVQSELFVQAIAYAVSFNTRPVPQVVWQRVEYSWFGAVTSLGAVDTVAQQTSPAPQSDGPSQRKVPAAGAHLVRLGIRRRRSRCRSRSNSARALGNPCWPRRRAFRRERSAARW